MKTLMELTQLLWDRVKRHPIARVPSGSCTTTRPHPTAHSVFQSAWAEMPTISLRTVSQIPSDMVALDEIRQFEVGTGAARFDPAAGAHHHLVDTRGGAGRCATSTATSPACATRRRQHRTFTISDAQVTFRGLCTRCSQVTSHQKKAAREWEDQHV